jgi:hypothetical protein
LHRGKVRPRGVCGEGALGPRRAHTKGRGRRIWGGASASSARRWAKRACENSLKALLGLNFQTAKSGRSWGGEDLAIANAPVHLVRAIYAHESMRVTAVAVLCSLHHSPRAASEESRERREQRAKSEESRERRAKRAKREAPTTTPHTGHRGGPPAPTEC